MIPLVYAILLAATLALVYRRLRGRTLQQLVRRPPAGSDLNAIVSTLSYIEHELIKHRIPILASLTAKRSWNEEDRSLWGRTVGQQESSLASEFQRYLDGIQRGAGRTLVNFGRDRVIHRAARYISQIQRAGERWARQTDQPGPSSEERKPVEEACRWLSGPFREYLIELSRSLFRCPVTRSRLMNSARRGLLEAGTRAELTVADPPPDCVARILAADLDVALGNLVRNAAEASPPDGRSRRVHIDVSEAVDETGEESVLVRVHDTSAVMLSRGQIYGREAKRGLGLVTAALSRHQGALRCLPSGVDGFAKAMEIRLPRSMHTPDPRAMAISKGRPAGYLLIGMLVLVHAALLAFVVVPYFSRLPVNLSSLGLPQECSHDRAVGPGNASVVCTLTTTEGVLSSHPLELGLAEGPSAPLDLTVDGPACAQVTFERPVRLQVDLTGCLADGLLEPHLGIHFTSPLYRAESLLSLEVQVPRDRLLATARAASSRGDLPLARRLLDLLSSLGFDSTSGTDAMEVALLRGQIALLEGVAIQVDSIVGPSQRSRHLCSLAREVDERASQAMEGASSLPAPEAAVWEARTDYLVAQADLWLEGNPIHAARVLDEIESFGPSGGPIQGARFYLALLGSQGIGQVSAGRTSQILTRMALTYQRPPLPVGDPRSAFLVDLVGAPVLFGQAQAIPVPEAICALRHQAPDLPLPPDLAQRLSIDCSLRDLDPITLSYLDWASRLLQRIGEPLDCTGP